MAHFTKRIFPFFKIGLIFNVKQKKLNIFTICLTNFCEDTTFVLSAIDIQVNLHFVSHYIIIFYI